MRTIAIAVLAAATLLSTAACGDDDDTDEALQEATDRLSEDVAELEEGGGAPPGSAAGSGGGHAGEYPDEVRAAFESQCTAQGATAEQCGCTFDYIADAVPFDEYLAFEEAVLNGEDADPPRAMAEAVTSCS